MIAEMNLMADLNDILLEVLTKIQRNYKTPMRNGEIDSCKLLYDWYFYCKRHIPAFPRKVLFSKELDCPIEFEDNVEKIKQMFINGQDVNGLLSDSIKQINGKDMLLSYWDIYHLHLGEIKDIHITQERRRELEKKLLFIKLYKDIVFFISIGNHREWTDKSLLERLSKEFPESIDAYEFHGVESIEPKIDDNDLSSFWKANINTFVEVNGKKYSGLGRMSNGDDGESMIIAIKKIKSIKNCEKSLKIKYGNALLNQVFWFKLRKRITSDNTYFEVFDVKTDKVFYRILA